MAGRRKGGLFRRIFRALNPFRARVTRVPRTPAPPPFEPPPSEPTYGSPFGWHLVGYYSPGNVSKANWQDMQSGAPYPTDREFHASHVLRFRLGNTDKYRSFVGPTDATIDEIIEYLEEEYGEDAA